MEVLLFWKEGGPLFWEHKRNVVKTHSSVLPVPSRVGFEWRMPELLADKRQGRNAFWSLWCGLWSLSPLKSEEEGWAHWVFK